MPGGQCHIEENFRSKPREIARQVRLLGLSARKVGRFRVFANRSEHRLRLIACALRGVC
jgi:hypothetical protein